MRIFINSLLVFFLLTNISCGVKKSFRDDVSLLVTKDYLSDSIISEQPYYGLKFYINLQ